MEKKENKFEWKLKDIIMISICAVLFGVVYLGAVYGGQALGAVLTPMGLASLSYEPFYGIWFMSGAFAVYVMRKPGTGILAELLAAIIEVLLGNFFGPKVIISGIVQGLGFELLIAIFRYKKFDYPTMILSSVICSVITLGYNMIMSGYSKIDPKILLLMLAVRIISAVVFCGFLTKLLGDGLAKAGVLKAYPVSEGIEQNLED